MTRLSRASVPQRRGTSTERDLEGLHREHCALCSPRVSAERDEHGAALTIAEVIVNRRRLTAVLR